MMLRAFLRSILLLLLIAITSAAQTPKQNGSTLQERAQKLAPYFAEAARRYGLDARVLEIICFMESRYRLDGVSPKGARGPMQLMRETAQQYGVKNPHDPKESIDAAARYLRNLLERFGGRLDLAFAAYNAGEGTIESYLSGKPITLRTGKIVNPRGLATGGIPPYNETRAYVKLGVALFLRNQSEPPKHRTLQLGPTLDDAPPIRVKNATSSFIEVP